MQRHSVIYCPHYVACHDRLPESARLLYGVIITDAGEKGYCSCSNQELGDFMYLSAKSISRLLAQLERIGYITRQIIRDENTNEVIERRIHMRKEDLDFMKEAAKGWS